MRNGSRSLGNPVPVAERVGSFRDGGFFSASANDRLIYRTADTDFQVAWFDRRAHCRAASRNREAFAARLFRPMEHARSRRAPIRRTRRRPTCGCSTCRVAAAPHDSPSAPAWSSFPSGLRTESASPLPSTSSSVHQKLASGEGDETDVLQSISAGDVTANGWSPDGQFLSVRRAGRNHHENGPLGAAIGWPEAVPFARTAFDEGQGRFSQNGRWIAYVSNQSGAIEVYVRAFTTDFSGGSASTGGSVLVSRGGGTAPRWRGDGRELFYVAPDGKMMAVEVSAGPEFRAGDADAALSGPERRDRRRRVGGRQTIPPRDPGWAERDGAVHGRPQLDGRIEEVTASLTGEDCGDRRAAVPPGRRSSSTAPRPRDARTARAPAR